MSQDSELKDHQRLQTLILRRGGSRSLVSLSLAWFLFNIKDSDIFDLDSLGNESPPNKMGNALDDDGEDSRESDFVSLRHHLGETIQNNPSS